LEQCLLKIGGTSGAVHSLDSISGGPLGLLRGPGGRLMMGMWGWVESVSHVRMLGKEGRFRPLGWGIQGPGADVATTNLSDCRQFRRHCLAFAPESRIFFTTPFASGLRRLMNHPAFERRESTPISALAAVLAAAIVLSVGGATGSLGGFAPAAVGAVLIGGIGRVAANAANPLADGRTAPRTRPVTSAGSSDHEAHPAVSILRMSGPSGPASADLPPPTVA
jgi:hypothetical protein